MHVIARFVDAGGSPAIAHMVKHPHQVILIAQSDDDVPFDLRPRRYLKYENSAGGGPDLERGLAEFIEEAISGASGQLSESIVGREERTRRIVADCAAMLRTGAEGVRSLQIRFAGGLSPLSISPRQVQGPKHKTYGRLLQDERLRTIELLRAGASFRAILAPRVTLGALTDRLSAERFRLRFEEMIRFLKDGASEVSQERIEIALVEPYYVSNVLILGEQVLYDGIKAGMGGGFDLSIRSTDRPQIVARTRAFDSMFADATTYTLKTYGGGKGKQGLRAASLRGLEELFKDFRSRL